jgi:hypothetical protein
VASVETCWFSEKKRMTSSRWYGDCGVVDVPVTEEEKVGFPLLGRVTVVIVNVPVHFAGEEKNGSSWWSDCCGRRSACSRKKGEFFLAVRVAARESC